MIIQNIMFSMTTHCYFNLSYYIKFTHESKMTHLYKHDKTKE